MATNTRDNPARKFKGWLAPVSVAALALALIILGGAASKAEDAPPLEYQVKAAFLVKFALFVEWPAATTNADTNAPFVIGVLGKDPFGKNFDDAVKNERIHGHPVEVRRGLELSELNGCAVIFVCASESKRMEELLGKLDAKPVLTVADEPEFAKRGGMIGFIKEGGKVRFEINVAAAERAKLKLSSKLLQVGKIVAQGRAQGGG